MTPEQQQSYFDTVSVNLLKQNAVSMSDSSICKYRGRDGLKCAIGFLIPDDKYQKVWDDKALSIGHIAPRIGLPNLPEDITFFSKLQIIHDDMPVSRWRDELRKFAKHYYLNTNAMDAVQ